MTRKNFRILLTVIFTLFVATAVISFVFPSLVPSYISNAVEAYQKEQQYGLPLKTTIHFGFLIAFSLVGPLVGLVGLFFFRRWGRSVYTVIICTMPFVALFVGIDISSWAERMLWEWYLVGVGFALAIAWFSPLKEEFK